MRLGHFTTLGSIWVVFGLLRGPCAFYIFKETFLLLKLVRGKDSLYISEAFLTWQFDILPIAWSPVSFLRIHVC